MFETSFIDQTPSLSSRGAATFLTLWLMLIGFLFLVTLVLIVLIVLGSFFSDYNHARAHNMTSPAQKLSISLSSTASFMAGSMLIAEDRTNLEHQV